MAVEPAHFVLPPAPMPLPPPPPLDPEKWGNAKLWFARDLAHVGKVHVAKDYCDQVIQRFPNSLAAKETRVFLDELSKR